MLSTEEKIFEAARNTFQRKGFAGARMQEIADEAGINKAMLHYFFRNKEQLFQAVFMNAFRQIVPQINTIFNSDASVFDKIRRFTDEYISFLIKNPYLPSFIIQEMNQNPDFVKKIMVSDMAPNPSSFLKQIEAEIQLGIIKPINPKQLMIHIFSMSVFPFAAQMMVKGIIKISDEEFIQLMEERKSLIAADLIKLIQNE